MLPNDNSELRAKATQQTNLFNKELPKDIEEILSELLAK